MYLFELVFLFFSDIYPGVELLGHKYTLLFKLLYRVSWASLVAQRIEFNDKNLSVKEGSEL